MNRDKARRLAEQAIRRGSLQKVSEFSRLLALVAKLKPRVIVEIGTWKGGAFAAYAACAHPEALLVSVDLPGGDFGGKTATLDEEQVKSWLRPKQSAVFIRGDSHDPAVRLAAERAAGPVDFLMVDGDHTYDGCLQDFDDYAPQVRPGGLVAFHDILPHPQVPECQVDRVWAELKPGFSETWEFTQPDHDAGGGTWGGIGVARKGGEA